jgi:hypothetical protein
MKKMILLFILLIFGISGNLNATIITYYNIDFESPTHSVGNTPSIGTGIDTPSSIKFGQPLVESSFGHLNTQALVFNPSISTYEQIGLNMGYGRDNYQLSFDLETRNIKGSNYNFNAIFDAPSVQNLNFHGSVGMYVFPFDGIRRYTGNFNDNDLMHFDIDIDLASRYWTVLLNEQLAFEGLFNPTGDDINSIRFNLSPWYGGTGIDPSIYAAVDNTSTKSENITRQSRGTRTSSTVLTFDIFLLLNVFLEC